MDLNDITHMLLPNCFNNLVPASYSDIESFNKKLELDKLGEIATFFDVTIGFLTDGHKEGVSKERLEQIQNSFENSFQFIKS
jgi:hypothetical protein